MLSTNESYSLEEMYNVKGCWLFSVEVVAASDDALTVTLENSRGTDLISAAATTGATGGEFLTILDRYPIDDALTLTVADSSGGNNQFIITVSE